MEQISIVRFGDFTLDGAQRRLLRAGQDVYLPPKTFELLLYLLRNRGRVITKDELLEALWPDVNVVENTLAQRIREIREALGDGDDGAPFIKTVPRIGYQFRLEEPRGVTARPLISAGLEASDAQAVDSSRGLESEIRANSHQRLLLPILFVCVLLAGLTATG